MRDSFRCTAFVLLLLSLTWAGMSQAQSPAEQSKETGLAAVYSDRLNGHRTASGRRYDRNRLTAAHKTLPFGTKVRITNLRNGRTVDVVINDRGPRQAERILDISPRAAHALGLGVHSMTRVDVEVVG
jgi:rare lipoprotein A